MSEKTTVQPGMQSAEPAHQQEQAAANLRRKIRRHTELDVLRQGGVDSWLGTTAVVIIGAVIAAVLIAWLLMT